MNTWQDIVVWIIFGLTIGQLLIGVVRMIRRKKACGSNCKGCATIDVNKLERQIKKESPAFKS